MDEMYKGAHGLARVRDVLFSVGRCAARLAESVDALEGLYAGCVSPTPASFYVPTELDETWGRTLELGWTDYADKIEQPTRRATILATLALRTAIDTAIEAVAGVTAIMDGEAQSVDQRWSIRTIGHLRDLRGAIVRGHGRDLCPSALPMVKAGVAERIREHTQHVLNRMEEVKSAISAGVTPRMPTGSVLPDLLDRFERAVATAEFQADRAVERETEKSAHAASGDDVEPKLVTTNPLDVPLQQDVGDFRPAAWFAKGMGARLRMAARKDRKIKRVASRTIDGVVCYSVEDARRWWPNDVPKEK